MPWSCHSTPLLAFLIFGWVLCMPCPSLQAQGQSAPDEDPASMPVERRAALERMVAYWSSYLNTLGDATVPVMDKDVIVRQSYGKLFRDSAVQVEDDLDPARAVSIHKPIQAYLQDVEFFFKAARFEHEVLDIEAQQTDEGSSSWRIKTLRNLQAVDIRGDSINAVLTRYLEINETEAGLKIVSVYHSTPDRRSALRAWWASLSPAWRNTLSERVMLTPELPLAAVHSYRKGWLISSLDSFRLSDGQGLVLPDSVMPPERWEALDSLPLSSSDLDALLMGLQDRSRLDLSGRQFADWRPLEAFRRLERLDLSNSNLAQAAPLRGMLRLRTLDLSGTNVPDLHPLRFAQQLEQLHARNSKLRSPLPPFPRLRALDLSGTALDSFWRPPASAVLERLNLAGTGVQGMQWPALPGLKQLDMSRCGLMSIAALGPRPSVEGLKLSGNPIEDLAPLDGWTGLQRLWVDSTGAASLRAISALPDLARVDANATPLERSSVQDLLRQRPQILVVYETESLQAWWEGLGPPWRSALWASLSKAEGPSDGPPNAASTPSESTLHRMTALRSLDLRRSALCRQAAACPKDDSTGCLDRVAPCLEPLKRLVDLEALYLGHALLPPSSAARHWEALGGLERLSVLDLSGQRLDQTAFLKALPQLEQLVLDSTDLVDWAGLMDDAPEALRYLFADASGLSDSLANLLERRLPKLHLIWQSERLERIWHSLPIVWRKALQHAVDDGAVHMPKSSAEERQRLYPIGQGDALRLALWKRHRVTQLDLSGQNLDDLSPLSFSPYLQRLELSGNRIDALFALREVPLLLHLDVSSNPLLNLAGLGACSSLKHLDATNTPITDLEPVAALSRLENVWVSGTDIRSLNALEGLRALRVVHAANTNIRSLGPLDAAVDLEELSIFNTKLSESKVARFREAHPSCRITFY